MAKFNVQVRNEDNSQVISGVTVTAFYKDWLGNDQKQEEITNSLGWANFDIGVSQTQIQIEASKNGSIDKGTVFIDLFGNASPDHLILNLNFKPLEKGKDIIEDIYKNAKENVKLVTIFGTITAVIALAWYASSAVKPKVDIKPEIDIKTTKEEKE